MYSSEYEAEEEECYELETLAPIRPQCTECFKDDKGMVSVDDKHTYLHEAWGKVSLVLDVQEINFGNRNLETTAVD